MRNPLKYWLEVVVWMFLKPRKTKAKPKMAARWKCGHMKDESAYCSDMNCNDGRYI